QSWTVRSVDPKNPRVAKVNISSAPESSFDLPRYEIFPGTRKEDSWSVPALGVVAAMDEREFRRILDLFPVVRSRNYCADPDLQRESSSKAEEDELNEWQNAWAEVDHTESGNEDPFWQKLRLAAEKKVGPMEAEKFCKAFKRVHAKLVSEESNFDVVKKFRIDIKPSPMPSPTQTVKNPAVRYVNHLAASWPNFLRSFMASWRGR
ncbi:hypothetical protein Taro_031988, partial [Colocasia esculenta]|nr:hypothetical protein [Colocasia esculenta]